MGKFRKIYGALAGHAAISTAVWGGVKLRDVLLDAGISEDDPKIKHIIFEGMKIETMYHLIFKYCLHCFLSEHQVYTVYE